MGSDMVLPFVQNRDSVVIVSNNSRENQPDRNVPAPSGRGMGRGTFAFKQSTAIQGTLWSPPSRDNTKKQCCVLLLGILNSLQFEREPVTMVLLFIHVPSFSHTLLL